MLLAYMFELTSIFQRVSKFHLDFSLILNNNFVEPLSQYQKDSSKHNLKIFKELESMVTSLEKNKKSVKATRELYYQLCLNAEKSEERLKYMLDKGAINNKDLSKETIKTAELKVFAQEARLDYENKCKESTLSWQDFRERFFTFFETFDLREENRIDMVKRKTLALGADLRNFHKNENPVADLKLRFKEIDVQPASRKPKSIVELIFGNKSLDKFKMERREDFMNYENFKLEREKRMFDESFYVVDTEDASEEEMQDLKMLITLIFSNFMSGVDTSSTSRRQRHVERVEETADSNDDKLLEDNQTINAKKTGSLFHKASLRDLFIKECVRKIPEKRQPVLISPDAFTNLTVVLKSIISHMCNTNDRDPAKFIDMIRILNTFFTKVGDNKKYLFQVFNDVQMFKEVVMWSNGYKCLLKKKKLERESMTKPQGTILNPWRVIHGIQSMIVRKNFEDEQQSVL